MKIALISLGRRGAAPMYSFGMAKALSDYSEVLCVVSSYCENIKMWRNEAERNKKFIIYEIKTFKGKTGFILKTLNYWIFKKIAKKINQFKPDILYSPFGHVWNRFIFYKIKNVITVKTIHDVELHMGENSSIQKSIRKIFNYKTDKCVILSEIFRNEVVKKYGYDSKNVITIPHATFDLYNKKAELDLTLYNKLLFFGRIHKYKGIEFLIEAFENVSNILPDLKLVIAGQGDISSYKSKIDSNKKIEPHIKWIKDEEVSLYFKDIDIVVLPYIDASQSGVVPLANSFGKPCIVTNIGGLPDQIKDGITGLIIPPEDVDSLQKSIIYFYDNTQLLGEFKKNSYAYAKENTWNKSAIKLLHSLGYYN